MSDGDANTDGAVNNLDLTIWEATYGTQPAALANSPILGHQDPLSYNGAEADHDALWRKVHRSRARSQFP